MRIQLCYSQRRWEVEGGNFFLPKYADGLDRYVSLTESNFRKLFLSEKKKSCFFSRNISILFEDSLILTHYLSNL